MRHCSCYRPLTGNEAPDEAKTKRRAYRSARPTPLRLLIFLCIGLALAAAAGALVAAAAPDAGASSAGDKALRNPFKVRLKPVKLVARSKTGPTPPANVKFRDASGDNEVSLRGASVAGAPGEVVIVGVPAYKWRDGCGPTAAAMVVGYWDGHGYDDLVPGSAEWQTADVDQMMSTHGAAESPGHYEDYALPGETGATVLPDKSELPLGDEHASNSVADFAHTSWSVDGSFYGSTWSSLLGPGFTGYVKLEVSGQHADEQDLRGHEPDVDHGEERDRCRATDGVLGRHQRRRAHRPLRDRHRLPRDERHPRVRLLGHVEHDHRALAAVPFDVDVVRVGCLGQHHARSGIGGHADPDAHSYADTHSYADAHTHPAGAHSERRHGGARDHRSRRG